jgi:hypothetical protein
MDGEAPSVPNGTVRYDYTGRHSTGMTIDLDILLVLKQQNNNIIE